MEERLKDTLAGYLKTEPSLIKNDTVIDRSALGNSILLHRLYADFSQQGYTVSNYNTIRTYGELKDRLGQRIAVPGHAEDDAALGTANSFEIVEQKKMAGGGIGADVEDIENFESASDYREHSFYKNNFTDREISYCLLQENARTSLAGLFAGKEALIKADNSLLGIEFNRIEIQHDKNGKPYFQNFLLSITHTNTTAFAVAFKPTKLPPEILPPSATFASKAANPSITKNKPSLILLLAFIFSCAAMMLQLISLLRH